MNDICQSYKDELQRLDASGNLRKLPSVVHDGKWVIDGGRKMLNLSSNDYLGLSTDKALRQEFISNRMTEECLFSSSSSRLLTGNCTIYDRLETLLADLFGAESALVFCSGYHMNTGILPAVTDSTTLILADKLVHASIIDGLRLCEAEMMRYRHLDYEHLRSLLLQHREEYGNVFIVTESIFSMDGDIADLQQLCEIKKEFDAFLYVDEAHAVGVRGTNGLGCCEEQGCMEDIDFIVGTFGKAFASMGAFVVCEDLFRDYLVNTQRSLIFTTALPPVNVAWTRFILNRMPDFYDLRIKLAGISRKLREILVAKGFETRGDSHIVPMICGSNENSVEMAGLLQDNGFFALPVRYPTVPKNEARIRFSLNASIGMEDYECLFEFLECLE